MNETEAKVMEALVLACNLFLTLPPPPQHHEDREEFRHAIHMAQNIVLARLRLELLRNRERVIS